MTEKTYSRNGEEFIIEECSRKEMVELIGDAFEGIRFFEDEDTSVYVEYKDGRRYHEDANTGHNGSYRKTNIKFALITNSATQQVFGKYEVDENGIVRSA